MKTYEQWFNELCLNPLGDGTEKIPTINIDEETIEAIQLDAYKAGMTRAMKIAVEQSVYSKESPIKQAIEEARDSLTHLPPPKD